MFQVKSIVLTAALFGHASATTGCYSTYINGGSYSAGSQVSATKVTETTTTTACTVGDTGCDADGYERETTTTSETNNYECTEGAWCSQSAYTPIGIYSGSAWTKESAECVGTATPATASIPTAWTGGGCPKAYSGGTEYDADDVVSVAKTGYSMVYQCAAKPTNQFCGMDGYSPGTDQYWDDAWSELGSCTGTIAPTDSPSFNVLTDEGGCPGEYDAAVEYEEGDKVSKMGLVYQCKSWPQSQHCKQDGYEPGTSIDGGAKKLEYWKDAWLVVGYCSGSITPTTSPVYVSLPNMGGCPDTWSTKSAADAFEEGDRVSSGGLVYQCKSWPYSGHCGQAGYEPNVDPATPDAWKDAWTAVGYCMGSMGPTSAPSFDPANSVGACPDEWSSGTNTKYEEGDMVSVTVSSIPLRKVAYKCKAWPFSGHCGQFNPTQFGGDQGWTLAGSCDGSIGPTASPSFDKLALTGLGCPAEWSASSTDYEAGDMVSYTVSDSPERKIVYKCREWPNTGYCNQGAGFTPGTEYGKMAWTLMGACEGSMAPTAAPAPYAGTCEYRKCVMVESTETNCTPGSTGCSCRSGQTAGVGCTKKVETKVCTDTPVNAWVSSVDYFTNDVVRLGTKRFKCREWPNYFWCRMSAYRPSTESNSIWNQAWTENGLCS
mmetsp:Transcript_3382/g.6143  ORF Transcript_3382/g.6143 Transcript_3382/m.6143 type:complete len:657 (+) Transcript_3382:92-2062(+)